MRRARAASAAPLLRRPSTTGRSGGLARSRKQRRGTELLCEYVFRPLAHPLVLALAPLRVPPPAVVAAGAATGLVAAVAIADRRLVLAAVLLQAKTVLDNADGQLARLTGRVTVFGRYLDSESDLLVNAALFAALGWTSGRPLLAAAGFACLTLVLGVNFNLERLYRRERGERAEAMPAATGAAAVLARVYGLVYAPQDRLVERFCARRLRGAGRAARLAYHDARSVSLLANFGLSTQLAALGVCLAAGRPGPTSGSRSAPPRRSCRSRCGASCSCAGGRSTGARPRTHKHRRKPVNPDAARVVDLHPGRQIAPEAWQRYERHIAEIFEALGMDLDTPGTRETPQRFLRALHEATAGYDGDPKLVTAFPSEATGGHDGVAGQIVEGPIAFASLCEHHALPFHGVAHVGYVAGDEIIGISKLTRLVRLYARRFTVQERLGEQIADTLVELVAPRASPSTSRPRTSARRCAASRSTRARSRPSGAAPTATRAAQRVPARGAGRPVSPLRQ